MNFNKMKFSFTPLTAVLTLVLLRSAVAAPMDKKEVELQAKQDLTATLAKYFKEASETSISVAASNMSRSISYIPRDTVSEEMANWIKSSLVEFVNQDSESNFNGFDILKYSKENESSFKVFFSSMVKDDDYYISKSKELLKKSADFRKGVKGLLFEKMSGVEVLNLHFNSLDNNGDFEKSCAAVVPVLRPELQQNFDPKKERILDYRNRIESKIVALSLVREIWTSSSLELLSDRRLYGSLPSILTFQSDDFKKNSGIAESDFSAVKAKVSSALDSLIKIEGKEANLDVQGLEKFLKDYGRYFREPKYTLDNVEVKPIVDIKIDWTNSYSAMINEDEDAVLKDLLRKDKTALPG